MLYGKIKIAFYRLLSTFILFVGIISPIMLQNNASALPGGVAYFPVWVAAFIYTDAILFVVWVSSWFLSCKKYKYGDKNILIYAGWFHHCLKIDDKYMDEYNTFITFTPIDLSCVLNDGTPLQVRISLANRITLKINNQLYR